jgi:hypothetical protein
MSMQGKPGIYSTMPTTNLTRDLRSEGLSHDGTWGAFQETRACKAKTPKYFTSYENAYRQVTTLKNIQGIPEFLEWTKYKQPNTLEHGSRSSKTYRDSKDKGVINENSFPMNGDGACFLRTESKL